MTMIVDAGTHHSPMAPAPTDTVSIEVDPNLLDEFEVPEPQEPLDDRALRHLLPNMSPTQALSFRDALRVDELRPSPRRVGYRALYEAFGDQADTHWLDPTRALKPFSEILFRMRGPSGVLSPFMKVFTELARGGFCPTAFIRYVFLTRLGGDWDFRLWEKRHLRAMEILGAKALAICNHAAFRDRSMPMGERVLIRDVFVCKYVLLPMATWDEAELAGGRVDEVVGAWQDMPLETPLFIDFLRQNYLPMARHLRRHARSEHLVDMVGRLEVIARALPELEATEGNPAPRMDEPGGIFRFLARPPRTIFARERHERSKARRELIKGLRFWGKDPGDYFSRRLARGERPHHLVTQYRGMLALAVHALKIPAAFHSLPWVMGRIRLHGDPVLPLDLADVTEAMGPEARMGALRWHWERLMEIPATVDRQTFIAQVRAHDGRHPRCPRPYLWFEEGFGEGLSRGDWVEILEGFGVPLPSIQKLLPPAKNGKPQDAPQVPVPALLDLVKAHDPEAAVAAQSLLTDLPSGVDGCWPVGTYGHLDRWRGALGVLLKRAIPGFDSLFAGPFELDPTWGAIYHPGVMGPAVSAMVGKDPLVSIPFSLGETSGGKTDAAAIRARVRMTSACRVAENMLAGRAETGEAFAHLLDRRNEIFKGLREREEAGAPEKVLGHLKKRLACFDPFLKTCSRLGDPHKWLCAFLAVAEVAGEDGKGGPLAMGLLLARYGAVPRVRGALEEMKNDLIPTELDGTGLEALSALAQTLIDLGRSDREITDVWNGKKPLPAWAEDLSPFLIPKRKVLGVEAWDAALRRATGQVRLSGTLGEWREEEEKGTREKARPGYRITASRAPLDLYFGHMGGICLAGFPEVIIKNDVSVLRLGDPKGRIQGMALAVRGSHRDSRGGTEKTLHAIAVNPLPSFLSRCSRRKRFILWTAFRGALEAIARKEGRVVYLCTEPGIISNSADFAQNIYYLEKRLGSTLCREDFGFTLNGAIFYEAGSYRTTLRIIDPAMPKTFFAGRALEEL